MTNSGTSCESKLIHYDLPVHGKLLPADNSSLLSLLHSQCCGKSEEQDPVLWSSPKQNNKHL